MARHIPQPSRTITTLSGEVLDSYDDRVLSTSNIHTHRNVMDILSKNNICPDVHQADWIINQLPEYYTEECVLRIDASL